MSLPYPVTIRPGVRYVARVDVQGWMRRRLATEDRVREAVEAAPALAGLLEGTIVQRDASVDGRFWVWAVYTGPEQVVQDLGDDVTDLQVST